MEDKIIEKYLYAVHKAQESDNKRVSKEEFLQAVESSGLTERDLAAVSSACERLAAQGETYLKSGNHAKAADLLSQAIDIDPYNLNNLLLACHANLQAYLQDPQKLYAERISRYTERGLLLDPKQTYFAQVETELHKLAPAQKRAANVLKWAVFVSFLFIFTAATAGYMIAMRSFDEPRTALFIFSVLGAMGLLLLSIFVWVIWIWMAWQARLQRNKIILLSYKKSSIENPWMDKIYDALRGFLGK